MQHFKETTHLTFPIVYPPILSSELTTAHDPIVFGFYRQDLIRQFKSSFAHLIDSDSHWSEAGFVGVIAPVILSSSAT